MLASLVEEIGLPAGEGLVVDKDAAPFRVPDHIHVPGEDLSVLAVAERELALNRRSGAVGLLEPAVELPDAGSELAGAFGVRDAVGLQRPSGGVPIGFIIPQYACGEDVMDEISEHIVLQQRMRDVRAVAEVVHAGHLGLPQGGRVLVEARGDVLLRSGSGLRLQGESRIAVGLVGYLEG